MAISPGKHDDLCTSVRKPPKGGRGVSEEQARLVGHVLVGASFVFLAGYVFHWQAFVASSVAGYFLLLADSFMRERKGEYRATNFRVGALLVIFVCVILPSVDMLTAFRPVMDQDLRVADLWLGLDGFALSRFCLNHPSAYWTVCVVYGCLPLVMAAAWVASRSYAFLRSAVVASLAAVPCYLLFPAVGPEYAFQDWPFGSRGAVHKLLVGHPRNCMPSMHFAWACLAVIYVKGKKRFLFGLYAGLMSLSTVAGGEHYVVDVIAAVPFVLVITWICGRIWKADSSI
jgi:hypothetical protein